MKKISAVIKHSLWYGLTSAHIYQLRDPPHTCTLAHVHTRLRQFYLQGNSKKWSVVGGSSDAAWGQTLFQAPLFQRSHSHISICPGPSLSTGHKLCLIDFKRAQQALIRHFHKALYDREWALECSILKMLSNVSAVSIWVEEAGQEYTVNDFIYGANFPKGRKIHTFIIHPCVDIRLTEPGDEENSLNKHMLPMNSKINYIPVNVCGLHKSLDHTRSYSITQ